MGGASGAFLTLLAFAPTYAEEGMVVTGIATPSYGTTLTATLNTWRLSTLMGWKNASVSHIRRAKGPLPPNARSNDFLVRRSNTFKFLSSPFEFQTTPPKE